MPAPIEVRKVPLHNVSDASELAKLIDDGVMEADGQPIYEARDLRCGLFDAKGLG